MMTSFDRGFWKSQGRSRASRSQARKPSCRTVLQAEALEGRLLPSLTPKLLLDINPGSMNSNPGRFTQVNNLVFFRADDGTHVPELWASNGTAAGTYLVKAIGPAAIGSDPKYLTNVN